MQEKKSLFARPAFWIIICIALALTTVLLILAKFSCDSTTEDCDRPIFSDGWLLAFFLVGAFVLFLAYWWNKKKRMVGAIEIQNQVREELYNKSVPRIIVKNSDIRVKMIAPGYRKIYIPTIGAMGEWMNGVLVSMNVPGRLYHDDKRLRESTLARDVLHSVQVEAKKQEARESAGSNMNDEGADFV